MAGKIIDREKYGGLRSKLPLFPAIIIPSKVSSITLEKLQMLSILYGA